MGQPLKDLPVGGKACFDLFRGLTARRGKGRSYRERGLPQERHPLERDRELIAAVLAGDMNAFDEIVKSYQRPIYYLSLRMLKNQESADEVTQKTFLKAYRALGGFQFKSSLKTWLSAIALNLCRTELMRPKRQMVELPDQLPDSTSDDMREADEQAHRRYLLEQALSDLPTRQKEVVMLRIYQELPFKEIAEALDSTESAVKVNFHHAMKSLKDKLGDRYGE